MEEVLSRINGTFLMQHSTPAALFARHASVSVLWAGDRYVLTLRDEVVVPPQAARSILEGWGWVDSRCEGLVAAFHRHDVDLRPFEVWRRNDGVLIATAGASRRRRLMAEINSVLPEQVPQFRTLHRRFRTYDVKASSCLVPLRHALRVKLVRFFE